MSSNKNEFESLPDIALSEALSQVFTDKETLAVIEAPSCQPDGNAAAGKNTSIKTLQRS